MRAQLGFLSEAEVHERFFSLSLSISLLIELLRERPWDVYGPMRCQRQHRRLNLFSSITVVPTLESACKLETFLICVFLSKDGDLRTESRDVQFRYFLIELLREEVLWYHSNTSANQAATALVRERPRHQEGMMTDVPESKTVSAAPREHGVKHRGIMSWNLLHN